MGLFNNLMSKIFTHAAPVAQRYGQEKSGETGLEKVDRRPDETCRHGQQPWGAKAACHRIELQRRYE